VIGRRLVVGAVGRRLGVGALAALLLLVLPAVALADYAVPLSPASPWPKFRRDNVQDGRSPLRPSMTGGALWTVRTGGGVFASPIIGADGAVYVGSADRSFWAISASGKVLWRFRTGELIDSSGLLDNRGRVYVPSGDGHIYALNARTGAVVWRFAALAPSVTGAFINLFEGNVAIGPGGTGVAGRGAPRGWWRDSRSDDAVPARSRSTAPRSASTGRSWSN
jgi:outer membrane protein assembly factor BamB